MPFCSQCGKATESAARFCTACGQPIPSNARSKSMKPGSLVLIVILSGCVAGAVVASAIKAATPTSSANAKQMSSIATGAPHASAQQVSPATPGSGSAGISSLQEVGAPAGNKTTAGSIDVHAVESILAQVSQHSAESSVPTSSVATERPASTNQSGADRYPGSQPVNVDNAPMPDIGISVSKEVYSTSDSVATVIGYYRQRYPDAQVMEINGQNVIAIDRPGDTKVIAIGTTGQETRIAMVRPAN